jgi:Predicted phosphoribosyltransferases
LFGTATRELAELVAGDGYRPDIVLSIARDGLADHLAAGAQRGPVRGAGPGGRRRPRHRRHAQAGACFCAGHVADVRCAVVYEKPHSTVRCEYVWRRTARWINFPWSSQPPAVRRAGQVLDA